MALSPVDAKITLVAEAASPIPLRSSTPISTHDVKVIVHEVVNDEITVSARSSELTGNPQYAVVDFDGASWRIQRVIKLYGSPNYDIELHGARIA